MKDIRMAEFCDSTEVAVRNSPEELKKLHSRGSLTWDEYHILLNIRIGRLRICDVRDVAPTSIPSKYGQGSEEAGEELIPDPDYAAKKKEYDRRENYRKRVKNMKRYFIKSAAQKLIASESSQPLHDHPEKG